MPLSTTSPTVDAYATAVARSRSRAATPVSADATNGAAAGPTLPSFTYSRSDVPGVTTTAQPGVNGPTVMPAAAPAGTGTGEWTMPGITDPSWQVVGRGYQQKADTAAQNAAQQRFNFSQQFGLQKQRQQEAGIYSRRDISNDAESRGILRSGELERNIAEQMSQEQNRLSDLDMNLSQSLSGVDQSYATSISDLRGSFAEAQQRALQEQYTRESVAAAQQKAAEQAAAQQAAMYAQQQQQAQEAQALAAQIAAAQAAATTNVSYTSTGSSVSPLLGGFGSYAPAATGPVSVKPPTRTTTTARTGAQ